MTRRIVVKPGVSGIAVYTRYLYALWLLVAFNLFASVAPAGHALVYSTINGFVVVALSIAMLVRLWRREIAAAISPLSYVLMATAAYHGVGVLFFTFGSKASLGWVARRYAVTPTELLRVNLVVSVGIAILWTATIAVMTLPTTEHHTNSPSPSRNISWVARYCFVLGFGSLYAVVVPYTLGWLGFTLPGMVMLLAQNAAYAAIFLMAVQFHRSGGMAFRMLLPMGIVAGLAAGLLVTSKTYVVLTLFFYLVGRFYALRSLKGLALGAGMLLVVYMLLAPLIVNVREILIGAPAKSLEATASAWSDSLGGTEPETDEIQWGFLRLSYVAPEAFAISRFDQGNPGTSVSDGLEGVLMPRIFFPEKPVRSLGRAFAAAYNNNPNNSMSPGVFAEAYWNGGWLGLAAVSLTAGAMIGFAHRFVVSVLHRENWLMVPLCIGLFLGLGQINGFFSNTYVYTPVVLITLQFFLVACALPVQAVRAHHRVALSSSTEPSVR